METAARMMEKFDGQKSRWQRHANNNKLTIASMLMLSTLSSICGTMGQQEGAAALDQMIAYGQHILSIFLGPRTMDDVHCASLDDTKKIQDVSG